MRFKECKNCKSRYYDPITRTTCHSICKIYKEYRKDLNKHNRSLTGDKIYYDYVSNRANAIRKKRHLYN